MISSAVDGPSVGNRQGSSLSVPKVRLGRSAPSADAALDRSRPSTDTWQRLSDRTGGTAADRGYGGATPHAGRPTPSGPWNDAVERIERPDEDPALTPVARRQSEQTSTVSALGLSAFGLVTADGAALGFSAFGSTDEAGSSA